MIFVTVGSRPYRFDRLIKKIDELVKEGIIKDNVFMQIGTSKYEPQYCKYSRYLEKSEFDKNIKTCDILITHAGVGVIMTALKSEKKIVVVPRRKKYKEHLDDHQLEICEMFLENKILEHISWNIEMLDDIFSGIISPSKYEFDSGIGNVIRDFILK